MLTPQKKKKKKKKQTNKQIFIINWVAKQKNILFITTIISHFILRQKSYILLPKNLLYHLILQLIQHLSFYFYI